MVTVGMKCRDESGVLWVVTSDPDAAGVFRLAEVNGTRTATGRVSEVVVKVAS